MAEISEAPISTLNESSLPAAPANESLVPVTKKEPRKKEGQNEDVEFANAKAFLSTKITRDSVSVYDHLTSLISRILETKPINALGANISAIYRCRFDREHICSN